MVGGDNALPMNLSGRPSQCGRETAPAQVQPAIVRDGQTVQRDVAMLVPFGRTQDNWLIDLNA
jgi:hypothetical protein